MTWDEIKKLDKIEEEDLTKKQKLALTYANSMDKATQMVLLSGILNKDVDITSIMITTNIEAAEMIDRAFDLDTEGLEGLKHIAILRMLNKEKEDL